MIVHDFSISSVACVRVFVCMCACVCVCVCVGEKSFKLKQNQEKSLRFDLYFRADYNPIFYPWMSWFINFHDGLFFFIFSNRRIEFEPLLSNLGVFSSNWRQRLHFQLTDRYGNEIILWHFFSLKSNQRLMMTFNLTTNRPRITLIATATRVNVEKRKSTIIDVATHSNLTNNIITSAQSIADHSITSEGCCR